MALTRVETGITWSSASTIALSDNNQHVSDAITIDPTTVSASIHINASNGGTPASGDTVTAQFEYRVGASYDTPKGAAPLIVLNTYATDSNGENPQKKSGPIDCTSAGGKLVVAAAQGSSRTITITAWLVEHRAA